MPCDAGERHVYFAIAVDRLLEAVIERLAAAGITVRRPVFRPLGGVAVYGAFAFTVLANFQFSLPLKGVVFSVAALRTGQPYLMFLSAALVGACLGFLPYNFWPEAPVSSSATAAPVSSASPLQGWR